MNIASYIGSDTSFLTLAIIFSNIIFHVHHVHEKILPHIDKNEDHYYLRDFSVVFLSFSLKIRSSVLYHCKFLVVLLSQNIKKQILMTTCTSLERVMISGRKFTFSFNTFPLPPPLALVLSMVKIRPETPRFRCCTYNKEREKS